jgi:hypothetical protein
MIKRYTPSQIRDGTASYSFEAFLDDLWVDVETSLFERHPQKKKESGQRNEKLAKNLRDVFVFVYELCNLAARKHPDLEKILDQADDDKKAILQKTLRSNEENIALLHAIYSREVIGRLKQGFSRRQAEKATIEKSKNVFINWLRLKES